MTIVFLMHYFTIRLGLFLNRLFAIVKVILLLIIAFWGIGFGAKHYASKDSRVLD